MKLINHIFVFCFFVATLVPTQIFHYSHVVSDISEHYQHHKDKPLLDFLSHALSIDNQTDSKHPEHNHSPFNQHHVSCTIPFVSIIPDIPRFKIQQEIKFLSTEKQKFQIKSSLIKELSFSIWQPPKLV